MKSTKLTTELQDSLLDIGRKVASLWGGECCDAVPDDKREVVVFHCIEHGENFATEVAYDELSEYMDNV